MGALTGRGQAGPVPGGLERACQKIASDYGLTAREGDVLRLLGRGRTARHIAGELGDVRRHGQDAYRPTSIASSVSTRSRACSTSSRSMWGGAEKSGARAQLARAGCGLEAIAVIAMAAIAMPGRCKAATDLHVCLGKFVQIRRLDAARAISPRPWVIDSRPERTEPGRWDMPPMRRQRRVRPWPGFALRGYSVCR